MAFATFDRPHADALSRAKSQRNCRSSNRQNLSSSSTAKALRLELPASCLPSLTWWSSFSRGKAAFSSGCKPHPATAPAGSNRTTATFRSATKIIGCGHRRRQAANATDPTERRDPSGRGVARVRDPPRKMAFGAVQSRAGFPQSGRGYSRWSERTACAENVV